MEVMEAIRSRRSIRTYQDRPVEEAKWREVLEAGRLAPSANDRQDWKFVVVKDPELRKRLVPACHKQEFIAEAALVVVACTTNSEQVMRSGYQCCAVDVTIAVDHMTLAATALGLGTCWIGAFDREKVAQVLGLPAGILPVHVMPLGYAAENPSPRPRKTFDEVVAVNTCK